MEISARNLKASNIVKITFFNYRQISWLWALVALPCAAAIALVHSLGKGRGWAILLLFASITTFSQTLVKGQVIDSDKGTPLANASVFLNNTSYGTKTNEQGEFLFSVPKGKLDLVVSSIGYETFNQVFNDSIASVPLLIKLKIKVEQLETVIIEPFEKDGWEAWGSFFTTHFIGSPELAGDCKIKNPETLRFRHSKKTGELTAIALEPLIIENRNLGYTLQYQLETFSFNFKTHYLLVTGFPFFIPMDGSESKKKKWVEKRKDVYSGSMMHFMRSVYRNKINEEGFELLLIRKLPNLEKQRVKAAYDSNFITTTSKKGDTVNKVINKDTADYYTSIMKQPDFKTIPLMGNLTGDSIAYAVSPTVAGLYFTDYLVVTYTKKKAPPTFTLYSESGGRREMQSQLYLVNGVPVEIEANGSYFDPRDLLSIGYWAWSEKIATMLPFDYKPGN